MGNERFDFRHFSIRQDRCAMRVGTDGVLLGAWAMSARVLPDGGAARILDVGTGTGVIALMAAQALPEATVHAVEVDAEAASQAADNARASAYAARVEVYAESLAAFDAGHPEARYDVIVSNPPYYDATLKPADAARATARHNDALTWESLMLYARRHLTPGGVLSIILPTGERGKAEAAAAMCGLTLRRLCEVTTRQGKPARRLMFSYGLPAPGRPAAPPAAETLDIRDAEGRYTTAYRRLVEAYYMELRDA